MFGYRGSDLDRAIYGSSEKRRTPISKGEWEAIKQQAGNKCLMCGRTEKTVGILEKAHIKAHRAGGTQYFPLCKVCHYKFDHDKATPVQLKRIGITQETYARLKPRQVKKKRDELDKLIYG